MTEWPNWTDEARGLWKLLDGRDWLREKLDYVLMGRAMLSKSLIQFSVDGWSCVPSLLFDLRPSYGGGNEDNGDLLQMVPCMHCHTQCPDPAAGPRWPTPPLESPGNSWASLGQSPVGSLLISPGSWCTQGSVCALQESVSPVLCKFWQLYGRVNDDLFHKGLCHSHVCSTQGPCPCGRPLLTHIFTGDTQTQFWLSLCGVSESWCTQGSFEPSEHLWWVRGLIPNVILPLLLSCWCFSFALRHALSFFGGIQHSPVIGCSAATCSFGVLTGEDEHMSFYSASYTINASKSLPSGSFHKPLILIHQRADRMATIITEN